METGLEALTHGVHGTAEIISGNREALFTAEVSCVGKDTLHHVPDCV